MVEFRFREAGKWTNRLGLENYESVGRRLTDHALSDNFGPQWMKVAEREKANPELRRLLDSHFTNFFSGLEPQWRTHGAKPMQFKEVVEKELKDYLAHKAMHVNIAQRIEQGLVLNETELKKLEKIRKIAPGMKDYQQRKSAAIEKSLEKIRQELARLRENQSKLPSKISEKIAVHEERLTAIIERVKKIEADRGKGKARGGAEAAKTEAKSKSEAHGGGGAKAVARGGSVNIKIIQQAKKAVEKEKEEDEEKPEEKDKEKEKVAVEKTIRIAPISIYMPGAPGGGGGKGEEEWWLKNMMTWGAIVVVAAIIILVAMTVFK
ncbi:MAG: hypothetical protein NTY90_02300 [Candidatus Micrarchaeota archaeon]|nr:hypothetical protein [Candidatus Micrarchaeota archaeon]